MEWALALNPEYLSFNTIYAHNYTYILFLDDKVSLQMIYEPSCEKANNLGARPGPTQTGLYRHRNRLEDWSFGFLKKRDCTIYGAKAKALISCAITAQLICVFVFAYACCWFSYVAAYL